LFFITLLEESPGKADRTELRANQDGKGKPDPLSKSGIQKLSSFRGGCGSLGYTLNRSMSEPISSEMMANLCLHHMTKVYVAWGGNLSGYEFL
jgi:hypothetical protein